MIDEPRRDRADPIDSCVHVATTACAGIVCRAIIVVDAPVVLRVIGQFLAVGDECRQRFPLKLPLIAFGPDADDDGPAVQECHTESSTVAAFVIALCLPVSIGPIEPHRPQSWFAANVNAAHL